VAWKVYGLPEAEAEVTALLDDESSKLGAAWLIGWLKAVAAGNGDPQAEPSMEAGGETLGYRVDGEAIVIFFLLAEAQTLLVLFFGKPASALPRQADLAVAAERLQQWRSTQHA